MTASSRSSAEATRAEVYPQRDAGECDPFDALVPQPVKDRAEVVDGWPIASAKPVIPLAKYPYPLNGEFLSARRPWNGSVYRSTS